MNLLLQSTFSWMVGDPVAVRGDDVVDVALHQHPPRLAVLDPTRLLGNLGEPTLEQLVGEFYAPVLATPMGSTLSPTCNSTGARSNWPSVLSAPEADCLLLEFDPAREHMINQPSGRRYPVWRNPFGKARSEARPVRATEPRC
jgi:hypothetical protein